jgi:hypothetical protein
MGGGGDEQARGDRRLGRGDPGLVRLGGMWRVGEDAARHRRRRISTYIAADIDALNVSDLMTTTAPGDRIDLASSTSNINANSGAVGDVWHASIIATPIVDVNP